MKTFLFEKKFKEKNSTIIEKTPKRQFKSFSQISLWPLLSVEWVCSSHHFIELKVVGIFMKATQLKQNQQSETIQKNYKLALKLLANRNQLAWWNLSHKLLLHKVIHWFPVSNFHPHQKSLRWYIKCYSNILEFISMWDPLVAERAASFSVNSRFSHIQAIQRLRHTPYHHVMPYLHAFWR